MNLLNQNASEPTEVHKNTAASAIAADLRQLRAMSGPPVLRQAVAGLIHLAFATQESDWHRYGHARDFMGQYAALRLCHYALSEIQKSVDASAAELLKYHRSEVLWIERAAAKPEEATAKIYWEAMEKLDAAGIDFEQLLSYHYASDDADDYGADTVSKMDSDKMDSWETEL